MLICGIESSCDETACAIVEDGRRVISNVVASQIKTHQKYGGVVPEIAAREHLESINYVIEKAISESKINPKDIDAFSATMGPGLVGCLLVGANAAKAMSLVYNKPFVAVDHLNAHVCANFINTDLEPPFLCLLVSGGHTQVIHYKTHENQIIVAETIDDAIGEVYDKIARLLNLPYPGGIMIDKLAQSGDPKAFAMPEARVGDNEFSFSGLKTYVSNLIKELKKNGDLPVNDICASFQECVTSTLYRKTLKIAQDLKLTRIAIAGGVAANSELRKKFGRGVVDSKYKYIFMAPDMKYCTDNAAMVASCAYFNPISDRSSIVMEVYSRR